MAITYATQCDRLRSNPEGDQTWIALISRAAVVDRTELESAVDLSGLLDEGETLDDFVSQDPNHRFYKSHDGEGNSIYFIAHSGFEFFFGEDGRWPAFTEPTELELRLHQECSRDALAGTLLGANNPRLNADPCIEREVERDGNVRVAENPSLCKRQVIYTSQL